MMKRENTMLGQNTSVFDSDLYSPLFTQKEMKQVWSDTNLIHCWLRFETAIAKVQAQLGIIPSEAAEAIKQACETIEIDWQRLSADTESVGMAIKPLIDQVCEHGDDQVKQYLHWGCTTQDLLDTSLAMRLKQSLTIIRRQLHELGEQLKSMTIEHKDTVCVARTNSMDALPTTWGLQVSSYLQEISRHIVRLDALHSRATTGMYGGAVGNLSSIGSQGLSVRKALFIELELTQPQGLNNGSLDNIVEVVQFFALIHGSLCRIANDVETMGRASIAELREGEGGGGSSTMPHKANPRASNIIQTLSRMGWMYASSAPNMMDQQDLRAASMRMLNWSLVPESALTVSTSLERAIRLIKHLIVNEQTMKDNFAASRNFIMSEAVMMTLAKKVGRNNSYLALKDAVAQAATTDSLEQALRATSSISDILTDQEIAEACNPQNYLGCNQELIQEAIQQFEQVAP